MEPRLISIVVPVYNEEGSLDALLREIHDAADSRQWHIQVIFVDDGSTDASWAKIKALGAADTAVGGVRFQTNAGKAAALMAGFTEARGDVVFMMDADLQDPPSEMPRMLETLDAGYDLVSGWKKVRHDPWHKVYPSRVFNKLIGLLTGVHLHDHVCGLKCFRRPVLRQLRLYGEFHRFIGVLAAAGGFRVTEIPTLHRPRTIGIGKYGFARFAKGFLDLLTIVCLTRYRWRPQHLIGVVGAWMIAASLVLCGLFWALPGAFLHRIILGLMALMIAVFPGLLLIAIGLVGQLVVEQRPLDDQYVIAERVGWCSAAAEHEPAVSVRA
ncbi:MAG: glycosyltransferase family 2 protein [Planctomycetes bacterium]|nr:glycosyltransferase family 2 protein [Planctomycetota bacterium]